MEIESVTRVDAVERIGHDEAMAVAAVENRRFADQLAGFGGNFVSGAGGEHVAMDAIEFCRVLAERAEGPGVLRHTLPI